MTVYTLKLGKWVEIEFELGNEPNMGMSESLAAHGYHQALGSNEEHSDVDGGGVQLFTNSSGAIQQHYIEAIGSNGAVLFAAVATGAVHLMETLRELQPLLALVALEQSYCQRIADQVNAEFAGKARK